MTAALLILAAQDVSPEHEWIVDRLQSVRFSARMDQTFLPDAVQVVADFTGLPIRFEPGVVDDLEEQDRYVDLNAQDATARDILRAILRPRGLTLTIREDAPTVVRMDDLRRGLVMRMYDVRDLTRDIRSYPADDPCFMSPREGAAQAGTVALTLRDPSVAPDDASADEFLDELFGEGGEGHTTENEQDLMRTVRDMVAPDSWDDQTRVRFLRGWMIVEQTPAVHRQIRDVLNRLRENRSGDLRDDG